jgi:hypothetical protein
MTLIAIQEQLDCKLVEVTNWTYSDRYRAVEIPVSVARGVAPQRVVELWRNSLGPMATSRLSATKKVATGKVPTASPA